MLILNAGGSQKMLSNLACILMIYSLILTTDVCSKFCKTCRNKDVTVFRATTFLNEALLQIYFLGIYDLFKIINITTAK